MTEFAHLPVFFVVVLGAVLLAGALYVGWIGVAVLRSEGRFGAGEGQPPRPPGATFRQAVHRVVGATLVLAAAATALEGWR